MFTAGSNTPGYLPTDDDPPTFDTAREAWQYLVGEVERLWDAFPGDAHGACLDAHTALHNIDQSQPGGFTTATPGYEGDHDLGTHWWVEAVE